MSKITKIYADIDLTFNPSPVTGDIALRYDSNAVIDSIRNLLLTNFYERPFQPDLGSNLTGLLFEPANNLTANLIDAEIRNVISNYEPRCTINSLQVIAAQDQNSFSVNLEVYIGNNTDTTTINLILQRNR